MAGNNDSGGKRQSGSGVSVANIVWSLVLVGYGCYHLTKSGRHTAFSNVWDWSMIVGGSLLAILALFAKAVGGDPQGAAKRIDDLNRKIYSGTHEREVVDESRIAEYGLDVEFYREATEALRALGFRKLNDVVNLTLRRAMPSSRAVVRTFLNADGSAMGAVYDLKVGGLIRAMQLVGAVARKLRAIEFESELTDGTFVTTSSAASAGKASEFTGISRQFLSPDATAAELLAAHRTHLSGALALKPGVAPLAIRSYEELMASQDRLQLLKTRHRSSAAFDPAENIARIVGKPLNPEQQEAAAHAAELHARRVSDAGDTPQ